MTTSILRQLKLLLWKNAISKKRQIFTLFLETFVPFVLIIILGLIRHNNPVIPKTANGKYNKTNYVNDFVHFIYLFFRGLSEQTLALIWNFVNDATGLQWETWFHFGRRFANVD